MLIDQSGYESMDDSSLARKCDELRSIIRSSGRVIVAFSGGVDSSLVAFVANQELGSNALAVTSGSYSLKRSDLALTKELAEAWGLKHQIVMTDELEKQAYRSNPITRCFHCKTSLYTELGKIAEREGFSTIFNGTNVDDLGEHRPGLLAARNFDVSSPLVEAGFRKADVRAMARSLGMANADKPQAACLSSRVPYGTVISEQVLEQIETAEAKLAALGFRQFRVRHHGDVARLEIEKQELARAFELCDDIQNSIRQCGYRFVTLDLRGFRSGSLNEGLLEIADSPT